MREVHVFYYLLLEFCFGNAVCMKKIVFVSSAFNLYLQQMSIAYGFI